jgi:hypothetical protein
MNTRTANYQFNADLTLQEPSQVCLSFPVANLSLTWQDNQLIECRLTFQIASEFYQHIDAEALFNLKSEIRSTATVEFSSEYPIEIQVTLKPDRLPDLADHASSAETTANYLLQLSQETPDHPLLYTENWLALSVRQQQESGEVGYTTLWATLNPARIAAGTVSEVEMTQAITQFFSDWTVANLGTLTEKATTHILNEVGSFFNDLADISIEALAQVDAVGNTILSHLLNFFTEDDWSFTKLQGEPVLRLAFQGENGKWSCYAKAREEQQQFVFYSICPIVAPEEKRSVIAEFITRANYGMTIGNFELDFEDGEIRYKASIDVEGDRLTPALIKNLVYTNVMMMDEYLPGIKAVIDGEQPEGAVKAIEQPKSTSESMRFER